jgi:ABC-type multidrug transport system fused ATPase/permease subunit
MVMGLPSPLRSAALSARFGEECRKARLRGGGEDAEGSAGTAPDPHWLAHALHATVFREFWLAGLLRLLAEACSLGSPLLLRWLIASVADDGDRAASGSGWAAAACLAAAQVANVLLLQQFIYGVFLAGGGATTALAAAVHAKALRLPEQASAEGAARVTNLVGKDAAALRGFVVFAHNFWTAPLSVLGAVVLLLFTLGWPALVGVSLIPGLIPLEKRIATAGKAWRKKTLIASDERVGAIRAAVRGAEALKLDPEAAAALLGDGARAGGVANGGGRVGAARAAELASLRREIRLRVQNQVLMRAGPLAVALASFAAGALAGRPLTAPDAFTALALFNGIGHPFHVLPKCVSLLASAKASVERLQGFLEQPELPPPPRRWRMEGGRPAPGLHAASCWAGAGLTAVCGPSGGGKTMLLRAALGEHGGATEKAQGPPGDALRGESAANRDPAADEPAIVAYCADSPWLLRASVRDNILLGRAGTAAAAAEGVPVDEAAYRAAIAAVALEPDLRVMPAGDATVLGDGGATVSGGQRARIALARAVYSGAHVAVLDDPLMALDAATAAHCFAHAVGALRARGAVLMTAHNRDFLVGAEQVLACEGGATEKVERAKAAELVAEQLGKSKTDANTAEVNVEAETAAHDALPSHEKPGGQHVVARAGGGVGGVGVNATEVGAVAAARHYLQVCGWGWVGLTLALTTAAHLLAAAKDVVLGYWTAADEQDDRYLSLYAATCFAVVLFHWVRFELYFKVALKASQLLHAELLRGVFGAPLGFFERTAAGDITARFASDTDVVDAQLPTMVAALLDGLLQISAGLLVAVFAAPLFALALPPIGAAYWWTARRYRRPARALKKLDNASKGPIFSQCHASVEGAATARAYMLERFLVAEFDARLDENNRARYSWDAANRWLSVRLELVGAAVVGAAAAGAASSSGAAMAGLAVTSALFATRSLSYCVRALSQLEQQLNNLDRIVSLARLPPEEDAAPAAAAGPANWPPELALWPPAGGCAVELRAVGLEYEARAGALALDGLDLHLPAGSRVGLCGRSGAGKSSVAKVLARLHPPTKGVIEIGGVSAASLPLQTLRTRVAVVPQVPQVLGRTIREVLDPSGGLSSSLGGDASLWVALEAVGLEKVVAAASGRLDADVAGNWSGGERQLLALARAVLRRPAVLVLDESTSQLDGAAAARVRALLQHGDALTSGLHATTVLVVAHRLADVCACDTAAVMARGKVVEVGPPVRLLEAGDGSALGALAAHLSAESRAELAVVAAGGGGRV